MKNGSEGVDGLTRRRALLSVPGLLAASHVFSSARNASTDKDLEIYAQQLMAVSGTPGLSLAFGTDAQPSFRMRLGLTNVETREPVQANTLFPVASISKMVFAYGVLKYASQGSFDIDRPLVSYVLPTYLSKVPGLEKVTAREILSHSSGLPNWIDDDNGKFETPAKARGRFRYSGEAYFWLQLAVEAASGLSLNRFMTTVLFEPEGMKNSTFLWDSGLAKRVAFGHESGRVAVDQGVRGVLPLIEPIAAEWEVLIQDWTHDEWLRAAASIDPEGEHSKITFSNAAASLVTTSDDLYHFMTLLRATGAEPRRRSSTVAEHMLEPSVRVAEGVDYWWGLGCSVEKRSDGSHVVGHEGNNYSYRAYAGLEPETGRILVIVTNGDGGLGVYERLVRRILGHDQLSFLANLNPNYA